MDEHEWLVKQFETERTHLRAVAYRMLGDLSEADDAVQESWLRLSRSDTSGIENLGGWLTTVVARICLDMLRSRNSRREELLEAGCVRVDESRAGRHRPRAGSAAGRLGRARAACGSRHAASRRASRLRAARSLRRALRRDCAHRGALGDCCQAARESCTPPGAGRGKRAKPADLEHASEQWSMPSSAASRTGNFEALLTVLDPEVVSRHDPTAVPAGASPEVHGAASVARQFSGRAKGARTALLDGAVAAIVASRRQLFLVLNFTITRGKMSSRSTWSPILYACASCTRQSSKNDEPPPVKRRVPFQAVSPCSHDQQREYDEPHAL